MEKMKEKNLEFGDSGGKKIKNLSSLFKLFTLIVDKGIFSGAKIMDECEHEIIY